MTAVLWAGATQAEPEVIFGDAADPNKATEIRNLEVPGFGSFDVAFDQAAFAEEIYGSFPGDLTPLPHFFDLPETEEAANEVNIALTAASALTIGEVGLVGTEGFNIGWLTFVINPPLIEPVDAIAVVRSAVETGEWLNLGENFLTYKADERPWAVFTPVPEPAALGAAASVLAGLALVSRSRRRKLGL